MARRKRHPCEVTSDRLAEHIEKYVDLTDGYTRDQVGELRQWLETVAERADA